MNIDLLFSYKLRNSKLPYEVCCIFAVRNKILNTLTLQMKDARAKIGRKKTPSEFEDTHHPTCRTVSLSTKNKRQMKKQMNLTLLPYTLLWGKNTFPSFFFGENLMCLNKSVIGNYTCQSHILSPYLSLNQLKSTHGVCFLQMGQNS